MLNAAKPTLWRAWLLVAVACWACVAPAAALAFTPGFSLRGPETRVWDFFANLAHSRLAEPLQVADSHQGEAGCGYETVSGVHDYLYANGNPVTNFDPSGNFSLTELATTVTVASSLALIATPVVRPIVAQAVRTFSGDPSARFSLTSLGVFDESADLLDASGISLGEFSGNLFAEAFTQLGTDAVVGAAAAAGTVGVFKGFAAIRRIRANNGAENAGDLTNKGLSRLREQRLQAKLEARFGADKVLRERTLRDASGVKVRDPVTETGRRVDFIVLDDLGNARFSIEATSRNQVLINGKADQLFKESTIRSMGGIFIRDPATRRLIDVSNIPTRVIGLEPRQ